MSTWMRVSLKSKCNNDNSFFKNSGERCYLILQHLPTFLFAFLKRFYSARSGNRQFPLLLPVFMDYSFQTTSYFFETLSKVRYTCLSNAIQVLQVDANSNLKQLEASPQAGKPCWMERPSTVDLLIKVACFVIIFSIQKETDLNSKLVSTRVQCYETCYNLNWITFIIS